MSYFFNSKLLIAIEIKLCKINLLVLRNLIVYHLFQGQSDWCVVYWTKDSANSTRIMKIAYYINFLATFSN